MSSAVERHAYDRTADLAKSFAEHWESDAPQTNGDANARQYRTKQSRFSKWTLLPSASISAARLAIGSSHPAHSDCGQR
jgi:hypothetical protein